MEAFVWDDRFVTGIEIVDQQHRHLVDVVNQVGDMLLGGEQGRPRRSCRRCSRIWPTTPSSTSPTKKT